MSATTPDQPEPENPANRETVRITVREQETVRLPSQRSGPGRGAHPGRPVRRARRAPLPVAVAVATLWAALISYLPVAVVLGMAQFAEDAGSPPGAARLGLAGWLLGHGVPLDTPTGPIGLAPLALAALAAWRVSRAGVHVSRAIGARHRGTPVQALSVAGAVGLAYGVIGLLAAVILNTGNVSASPLRAGLTLAAFGAAAALVGALRTTGALRLVARRMPGVLRDGLRTGVVAAFLVFGAGAGAAGLAVALGGGDASEMLGAYRTGVTGQAGITLVCVAYAPNAAVWSAAYLLGPGFAVGTDTVVRTTEVSIGALPAVPLLAGLPEGPLGGAGAALLAVPVVAGMAAGWLLARRMLRADRSARWRAVLGAALLSGPVAGLVLGAGALVSGGSLGGGRMAEIGPVAWQVVVMSAVVVAVGAVIGAAGTRAFTGP
ncbi:cell division protein PerM [Phytohabitans sp. LJ34]|uniref:cell division protein PerM n=1 Tax=Phytohabitans sp. LJ34 TaxID=3452217 RepID=UPI003F89552A